MEKSTETNGKTPSCETLIELKADVEKKFLVTARLIESVMDAVEKTSSAKKCEADRKGIQLLKGELKEQ
jgi:hypothetical protein